MLKLFRFAPFRLRCEILGVDRLNHFPLSWAFIALLTCENRRKQPNLMLARRSVLSTMSGMHGAQKVCRPEGQGLGERRRSYCNGKTLARLSVFFLVDLRAMIIL
jgi:hypothetical protein